MKKHYTIKVLLLSVFLLTQLGFLQAQTNQYLHFDKVDDYVVLPEAGQYVVNKTAMSMTGWFYTDALGYGQGMMGFRDGSSGFYMIILNNGVIECRLAASNGMCEFVTPANTIIPQVWQHFAWVYDGSSVKLYSNGILLGQSTASGVLTNAGMPFGIGKSLLPGFNFVYGGRIDEVSVWDKGLTAAEVMDIKNNEITGTPANLLLYYKFNQGVPGGNNTSITKLISETGAGTRDADLMNFALNGPTSNFGGDLNPGFQAITFPQIPNHLTIDPPFELEAEATSGLDVIFTIESGPATINGTLLTLTGEEGEVVVKASQPGGGTWDPAEPIFNSFDVINPYTYFPVIDARSPLPGDVYVPQLDYIQLSAVVTIDNPELFFVQSVVFNVNGETITPLNYFNGNYLGWWMPPSYGSYQVDIVTSNNFGATATETININVVSTAQNMDVLCFEDIWLSSNVLYEEIDADLPSYTGAFDQITATLELSCPPTGGCGEWDRIAQVDVLGPNGRWVEIIRYITPYGTPCSHSIDLTDYMSLLQGKVKFRPTCYTLDNGYEWKLSLYFKAGTPLYNFGAVTQIWHAEYPFGDMANLQPVEPVTVSYPEMVEASTLKLVSTGHGWGENNTGNAAEFHDDTHHIWVNGEETFEQHNWSDCNPNPDGCMPQSGTWFYDRAGWCPGSIAPWFDFNMTPFISSDDVVLGYVFDEDYVDLCHPNNPDCQSPATCPNCDDGFNPVLYVACNLVSFSSEPLWNALVTGVEQNTNLSGKDLYLSPNPTNGALAVTVSGNAKWGDGTITVYNITGNIVLQQAWDGNSTMLDLLSCQKGMYLIKFQNREKAEMHKIVVK